MRAEIERNCYCYGFDACLGCANLTRFVLRKFYYISNQRICNLELTFVRFLVLWNRWTKVLKFCKEVFYAISFFLSFIKFDWVFNFNFAAVETLCYAQYLKFFPAVQKLFSVKVGRFCWIFQSLKKFFLKLFWLATIRTFDELLRHRPQTVSVWFKKSCDILKNLTLWTVVTPSLQHSVLRYNVILWTVPFQKYLRLKAI